ncbi:hypothetical protein RHMOL_Rhmol01G0351400 [Rhododendron molle]|uniref:Uncharacterized protein n=1 Tax=Rhododendron molle TaxID=49168 RepID=A0ACC0Q9G7_RHOML|nr:hypothetical protein RHMOL_Rhmol01G0351400 [Rhododendron molle]
MISVSWHPLAISIDSHSSGPLFLVHGLDETAQNANKWNAVSGGDLCTCSLCALEVRYKNLGVEAKCEVVRGKPLPPLWKSLKSFIFFALARHPTKTSWLPNSNPINQGQSVSFLEATEHKNLEFVTTTNLDLHPSSI